MPRAGLLLPQSHHRGPIYSLHVDPAARFSANHTSGRAVAHARTTPRSRSATPRAGRPAHDAHDPATTSPPAAASRSGNVQRNQTKARRAARASARDCSNPCRRRGTGRARGRPPASARRRRGRGPHSPAHELARNLFVVRAHVDPDERVKKTSRRPRERAHHVASAKCFSPCRRARVPHAKLAAIIPG